MKCYLSCLILFFLSACGEGDKLEIKVQPESNLSGLVKNEFKEDAEKWRALQKKTDPVLLKKLMALEPQNQKVEFYKGNEWQEAEVLLQSLKNEGFVKKVLDEDPKIVFVWDFLFDLLKDSGLSQYKSYFYSSTPESNGLFLSQHYFSQPETYKKALFYSFFGGEEKALQLPQTMPKDTLFFASAHLDFRQLMSFLDQNFQKANDSKLFEIRKFSLLEFKTLAMTLGLDYDVLMQELSSEWALCLTMKKSDDNESKSKGNLPESNFSLIMKNPGESIRKAIEIAVSNEFLEKTDETEQSYKLKATELEGLKGALRMVLGKDYLVISSQVQEAEKVLKSLRTSEEPLKLEPLTEGFNQKGNAFVYVSPELSQVYASEFFQYMEKDSEEKYAQFFKSVGEKLKDKMYFSALYRQEKEGISLQVRTPFNPTEKAWGKVYPLLIAGAVTHSLFFAKEKETELSKEDLDEDVFASDDSFEDVNSDAFSPENPFANDPFANIDPFAEEDPFAPAASAKKSTLVNFPDSRFWEISYRTRRFFREQKEKHPQLPKDLHLKADWKLAHFKSEKHKFEPKSWEEVFSEKSPFIFLFTEGDSWCELHNKGLPIIAILPHEEGEEIRLLGAQEFKGSSFHVTLNKIEGKSKVEIKAILEEMLFE